MRRLDFLNTILMQVPKTVNLNVTKFDRNTTYLYQNNKTVLDFILSAGWKTPPPPTQASTSTTVRQHLFKSLEKINFLVQK